MAHFIQSDGTVHGVAFGCRRADGRWLMVRRSHCVVLPNRVCFPGGGVEEGETQAQACIREGREELGITIRPLRVVWRHTFPQRAMTLFGWLAQCDEGLITADPLEIAEVLWLTREEALAHPDGLYTNRLFIDALEAAHRE